MGGGGELRLPGDSLSMRKWGDEEEKRATNTKLTIRAWMGGRLGNAISFVFSFFPPRVCEAS
jgi:hypothetical protein